MDAELLRAAAEFEAHRYDLAGRELTAAVDPRGLRVHWTKNDGFGPDFVAEVKTGIDPFPVAPAFTDSRFPIRSSELLYDCFHGRNTCYSLPDRVIRFSQPLLLDDLAWIVVETTGIQEERGHPVMRSPQGVMVLRKDGAGWSGLEMWMFKVH